MITYFYHINESKRSGEMSRHWFHHRWFWNTEKSSFSLEIVSRFCFSCEFCCGDAGDDQRSCMISVGLLFFSIYFSFPLPDSWLEHKKCIATWDNNREFYLVQGRRYGFYFYDWAFVWFWHEKNGESSSEDPWWMHQYIHIDELFLGKVKRIEQKFDYINDVYFRLGSKEFKVDKIEWERVYFFRSFIPFILYNKKIDYVRLDIKSPPMCSGKGENSWDCGDDGIFGSSRVWEGPEISYKNLSERAEIAVRDYVESCFERARKYGTARKNERGFNLNDCYEYIGIKRSDDINSSESSIGQSDMRQC